VVVLPALGLLYTIGRQSAETYRPE